MKGTAKPQGEIRLSQLVTTFGPGLHDGSAESFGAHRRA